MTDLSQEGETVKKITSPPPLIPHNLRPIGFTT